MGIAKNSEKNDSGYVSEVAILKEVDWSTHTETREFRYVSPEEFFPGNRNMLFKAGTVHDGLFIVPTDTEVLHIDLKTFREVHHFSHPTFNDLHHAAIINGNIHIVNTGLDMVQEFSMEGEFIAEYNTTEAPTWDRFNHETDYRKVLTTKPHQAHTNYVFQLADGSRWATRFHQKDAICLEDAGRKIDLNLTDGNPHDGKVIGDFIYFTLTDSHIVIVNQHTLKVEEVISLVDIEERASIGKMQLGWCRSIEIRENRAFVGFTRFRRSKFHEYARWLKYVGNPLNSRVAEYDLQSRKLVSEFDVSDTGGAAIYSLKIIG